MEENKKTVTNTKSIQYCAYLGILFLIGMFSANKDDEDVKFHVGQGILVAILFVATSLINSIIVYNIFSETIWGIKIVSPTGNVIGSILYLIPSVFAIIGLLNVRNGEKKELPIIGKFAFYK